MGQKTDARIFRQGIDKKNWELKHIEKNNEESSLYLYKTLEIQKYVTRFFGLYKMKIHNCKIFYSDGSIQLFVSFYITIKTVYLINKSLTKYSKKLSTRTRRRDCNNLLYLLTVVEKNPRSLKKINKKNPCWSKKMRGKPWLKKKRWFKLPTRKKKVSIKKIQKINSKKGSSYNECKTPITINLKEFQEIFLESLVRYTKNKVNISVTLQSLNRYKQLSQTDIENLKTLFRQLRKFVKNSFFKEAINIFFISALKRKSARLLAEFISDQFRLNQQRTDQMTISRKDNYFLGFLKQTIMLFVRYEPSCLAGVKIAIKGRFNRAPRARTAKIHFGKFSLQSFSSKIDYYQSTAYTANGTFGVKVWLCENTYCKTYVVTA